MVANPSVRDVGTERPKRVPKLEGVRGFLALGVIIFHVGFASAVTSFMTEPPKGFWGHVVDGMTVSLPPFFVLSGLLLYRSFARSVISAAPRPAVGRFLVRRSLRILPAYWLLILVGLFTLNLDAVDSPWDVARPLLLIHYYWAGGQPTNGLAHSWTVPAEMTFYLLMPVLAALSALLARRVGGQLRRALIVGAPPAALLLFGYGWVIYTNLPSFTGPFELWFWPFYYCSAFALGMIFGTMSAYGEVSERTPALFRAAARHPNLFWLGALAVFLAGGYKPIGTPGMGTYPDLFQELLSHTEVLVFSVLFIVPLIAPRAESRLMDAVLTNAPMRYLGRISYGIYLWHAIVVQFWFKNGNVFGNKVVDPAAIRGTAGFWELLAFTIVASVAFASVSYFLLERPIIRLGQRLMSRPPERPVPSVARDVPA